MVTGSLAGNRPNRTWSEVIRKGLGDGKTERS